MKKNEAYRGVTRFLVTGWAAENLKTSDLPHDVQQHIKALRIDEGEWVEILDGKGKISRFIYSAQEPWDFLGVREILKFPLKISLFLSPPRGDDFSQAISQATEMGIEEIHFLRTQHNQYPKNAEPWGRALRIVQAAQEQCGLPRGPVLGEKWIDLDEALSQSRQAVFCDESSSPHSNATGWLTSAPWGEEISLFVGPEGGWSQAELDVLRNRALGLSLGPLILKVPTAIVSASTFLRISCVGK